MRKSTISKRAVIMFVSILSIAMLINFSFAAYDISYKTGAYRQSDTIKATPKTEPTKTESANTICPVMGGEIKNHEYSTEYKGKTIYFCCKGCIEKFNKNPEKYMKKLEKSEKTEKTAKSNCCSTDSSKKCKMNVKDASYKTKCAH